MVLQGDWNVHLGQVHDVPGCFTCPGWIRGKCDGPHVARGHVLGALWSRLCLCVPACDQAWLAPTHCHWQSKAESHLDWLFLGFGGSTAVDCLSYIATDLASVVGAHSEWGDQVHN